MKLISSIRLQTGIISLTVGNVWYNTYFLGGSESSLALFFCVCLIVIGGSLIAYSFKEEK